MIYGIYQSAAGMMVGEYRQAVLANNIANADTVGFKREIAIFAERPSAAEDRLQPNATAARLSLLSGGQWLGETQTDFQPGAYQHTGMPTDFALDGPGFIAVRAGDRTLYTRDGRTQLDPDGTLVSVTDGAPLLSGAGQPLRLNPRGGAPTFDLHGRVLQDGLVVGELGIVNFEDESVLRKAGDNRFDSQGATPQPGTALVRAGLIEQSAVLPAKELVNLLAASRAYQFNAQMITLQDQTIGRMISLVASP